MKIENYPNSCKDQFGETRGLVQQLGITKDTMERVEALLAMDVM